MLHAALRRFVPGHAQEKNLSGCAMSPESPKRCSAMELAACCVWGERGGGEIQSFGCLVFRACRWGFMCWGFWEC